MAEQEGYASVTELIDYGAIYGDRSGFVEVSENVAVEATSTREGHALVGELIGYNSTYGDRTGFADVSEVVAVGAISTREGHGVVSELLGYDSVYGDRSGFFVVDETVTFRLPEYDVVHLPQVGWGAPMSEAQDVIVVNGTAEATASVSEYVGTA